jgi:peroxiredoxin Q/BCP
LRDYRGQVVVLFFYPQDDTPGCTIEACQFRDLGPRAGQLNVVVFGLSPDDVDSHDAFSRKFGLTYTLLSDPKFGRDNAPKVAKAYGVWGKKMNYGKEYVGMIRTTYVVNKDGKVAHRWDHVRVEGHAEKVLDWIEANP